MNPDEGVAESAINHIDLLDFSDVDQMVHVPAYDHIKRMPNCHRHMDRVVLVTWRNDASLDVLVSQRGAFSRQR
jgi:hypothetical protein